MHGNKKPVKYIAMSTFILQEPGANRVPGNDFASILGFNVPESDRMFQGDNLLQLYRTRFMIKKALLSQIPETKNEFVIDRYLKINGLRAAWKTDPVLRNIDFHKKPDKKHVRVQDSLITSFVNDIRNNYLNVFKDRLNLLTVEVRATNEEFAKIFNDQMVKTVNDYYIQTRTKRSQNNLRLLQHQTDSIRAVLNSAMHKVASSPAIHLNPSREILRLPTQKSQITYETNRAMLNELVRDLEVSKMSLRRETPLIQVMDEPVFPLEKIKKNRVKWVIIGALASTILMIFLYSVLYIYKKILD